MNRHKKIERKSISPYVKKNTTICFFRCLRYLKVISFLRARKHAVLCFTTILRVNSFLRYHLTVNLITCFTATKHASTTTMTSDGNESNLKHYVHFMVYSCLYVLASVGCCVVVFEQTELHQNNCKWNKLCLRLELIV